MKKQKIKVLYVDDNPRDREMIDAFIRNEGLLYDCVFAGSVAEGKKILNLYRFDIVILDYNLGDGCAFDLFNDVSNDASIMIVTGTDQENIAVQAMKKGAADYLVKDVAGDYLKNLPGAINQAITSFYDQGGQRR
ncbi:response regulator [Desulfococcaceae bacterium HSG7]|nr:response regulator [Desulfococcaceae bacterium HSG7]